MPDAEVTAPRGGAPQPAYGAAGARRFARDGIAYTWEEFVDDYGQLGQEYWDNASPANEVGEIVSAGDARQLAVNAADGGAPQPAVATADARRVPNQHGNQRPAAQLAMDAHGAPQLAAASGASQLAVIADGQA